MTMINIPNAKEYCLTCKVVDKNWDKYIVDKKVNKSHFGVNTEYVLVVPNEEAKKLLKEYGRE